MSLPSFSSGSAGADSNPSTPAAKRKDGSLVLVEDRGRDSDAAFELVLDSGLDTFQSERSQPEIDIRRLSAQPTGMEHESAQPTSSPARPESAPHGTRARNAIAGPSSAPPFIRAPLATLPPTRVDPVTVARPRQGEPLEQAAAISRLSAPRPTPEPAPKPASNHRPVAEPAALPVERIRAPRRRRFGPRRQWQWGAFARAVLLAVLTITGALEIGWIGMRVAGAFTQGPLRPAEAAPTPPTQTASARAENVPPAQGVSAQAPGPAEASASVPINPRAPVWVAISTPVPLEIFERGRRIGTSWGGGLRLSPGTHDLRIVNRAMALDARQAVEVVSGTKTSLVVDLADGRFRIKARRSE
jgi:hypothetical protein